MEIHPCVPDNWEQFNVDFKWKDAEYLINYRKTGKYKIQVFEVDNEKWKKEAECNQDVFDNKNELNYENEIDNKNELNYENEIKGKNELNCEIEIKSKNKLNYEIEDAINEKIELKNRGNYIINVMF